MSKDDKKDFLFFQLEYKSTNTGKLKLFDYFFVEKNKDKCKIIYDNKEYELSEYFKVDNNNDNNIIKIQLKINNNIEDLGYMFKECKELLSIRDISNLNNYSNINKSLDESLSYNYFDESDNVSEEECDENFYKDNLTISSIQSNISTSEFIGIKKVINNLDKQQKKIFYNVNNMISMFEGCSSLISLSDISKWKINDVTNMSHMLRGCTSLISFPDISKWDLYYVTNMSYMFRGCTSLISLPNISKWNLYYVTNISHMFRGCSSLISLPDISKWNLIHVTNISYMFEGCSSLISLPDISKWRFFSVENINSMFKGCSSLISLPDISNWNLYHIVHFDMNFMFEGCYNLLNFNQKFV